MRIMWCGVCKKLEFLDDFEGLDFNQPESHKNDVLLSNWIDRHMHGLDVDTHPGSQVFNFDTSGAGLDAGRYSTLDQSIHNDGRMILDELKKDAEAQVRAVLANTQRQVLGDTRDELREDASKCFNKHGNPDAAGRPCIDYRAGNKRLGIKGVPTTFQKWLCTYCPYESSVTVSKRARRGDYKA